MSSIIPEDQPFKDLDITVSYGSSSGVQFTSNDTNSVSRVDRKDVQICAFCRYTRVTFTAAQGCELSMEHSATGYNGSTLKYGLSKPADNTIQLDIQNMYRSQNADPLAETITGVQVDGQSFSILLQVPAFQQVDVTFNNGAFSYSGGDINTKVDPPTLTFVRPGAAYFTLSGATFDTEPFFWDNGKDDCIVDEGQDKSQAILTNLHKESESAQHSFLLQVVDGQGRRCRSEDPTIVNVEPPPPSGG